MMNSLFSSFDPTNSTMSLNLTILFVILLKPLINKLFMIQPTESLVITKIMFTLEKEIKATLPNNNIKDKSMIFISLFFTILTLNLLGLLPYIYSMTAQMAMTLSIALPLWLSFIMFNLTNSTNSFFSHLVPLGTPMTLSHFMTIIESVSQIIRPVTLSVRLAANITAGHILMILISNTIFFINLNSLILLMMLILELAVAFIQSYVFMLLLTMYLSETTYVTKP